MIRNVSKNKKTIKKWMKMTTRTAIPQYILDSPPPEYFRNENLDPKMYWMDITLNSLLSQNISISERIYEPKNLFETPKES